MLVVEQLTKVFNSGKGIFDVNFTVEKGEVFGFLGPNGAGKSTTIRHILGFMKPDKGSVLVNGVHSWTRPEEVHRLIGYLPGEIAFIEGMNGKSFLDFIANMHGLKDLTKQQQLIERFQFDVNTPIRKMSKGMKQKLGIVAAFMHDPECLILDESTSGLDPLMQKVFIDLVLEEKARGKTFLMSSHSFAEIERTCDRAAIIKDGVVVAVKNIHELQLMQRKVFEITFYEEMDAVQFVQSRLVEFHDGLRVRVAIQGNDDALIKELSHYRVRNLHIATQSLEEIFLNYYNRKEVQS